MSPRPRKVTDDEVFEAAQRAMAKLGPAELTLAEIAAEAGVTPGALVQRFGGKRELLVALSARHAGGTSGMFAALRTAHRSPLAALDAYVAGMARLAVTPEALARNLAYLQIDLTDPTLRAHLVAQARATRRHLRALLADAESSGELKEGTDPARLARLIDTVISGSLMTWACYREGAAGAWMRTDVHTALAPHLAGRRRRAGAARRVSERARRP
jgi:AcrR family transcriptional regulator